MSSECRRSTGTRCQPARLTAAALSTTAHIHAALPFDDLEAIAQRLRRASPAPRGSLTATSLIVTPPCSISRNASLFDFASPAITTSSVTASPAVDLRRAHRRRRRNLLQRLRRHRAAEAQRRIALHLRERARRRARCASPRRRAAAAPRAPTDRPATTARARRSPRRSSHVKNFRYLIDVAIVGVAARTDRNRARWCAPDRATPCPLRSCRTWCPPTSSPAATPGRAPCSPRTLRISSQPAVMLPH